VLNKLLHSLLDGKNNEQFHVLDRHPNRGIDVNMNNIDEKLLLYCRCLETFNL